MTAGTLESPQYVVFSKKTKILLLGCTLKKKRFILPSKINRGSTTKCKCFSHTNTEHSGSPPANHLSSSSVGAEVLCWMKPRVLGTSQCSEGHHLHTKYFVTFSSTKLSANSGTDFPKALGKMVEKISDSSRGNWVVFLKKLIKQLNWVLLLFNKNYGVQEAVPWKSKTCYCSHGYKSAIKFNNLTMLVHRYLRKCSFLFRNSSYIIIKCNNFSEFM